MLTQACHPPLSDALMVQDCFQHLAKNHKLRQTPLSPNKPYSREAK